MARALLRARIRRGRGGPLTRFADLRDLVAGVDLAALEAWLTGVSVEEEVDAALARVDPSRGWTSQDLLSDPDVSLGLFLLPAGQAIPLHDHPRMRGLLRVVRGRLRVRSYSWEVESERVARREPAVLLEPASPILRVTPAARSLHRLEAAFDCAFLDLFVPPYGDGRVCSYYREAEDLGGGRVRLERL